MGLGGNREGHDAPEEASEAEPKGLRLGQTAQGAVDAVANAVHHGEPPLDVLRELRDVRDLTERRIADVAALAEERKAPWSQVGEQLDVSKQWAHKKYGLATRAGRVAVVISRRDRRRPAPGDPRGEIGEADAVGRYEADRRYWAVGRVVRERARYAIVAVDGTVRRVYALDPDGWSEAEPGRWEFAAVGGVPLDDAAIAAAVQAGELPLGIGDDCPTRVGGAYRPHWF